MHAIKTPLLVTAAAALWLAAASAQAKVDTFSGNFNNPGDTALVASDLTAALFGSSNDVANNVALYTFAIASAQTVGFQSKGFAAGGADPYFTLFSGTGNGATFLQSNYTQAFSTGGDFNDSYALAAGSYTVAMGVSANMSFAENLGSGSLGDGFISLGVPASLGSGYYELAVSSVPEPATSAMFALAAVAAGLLRRRKPQPA